MGIRRLNIDGTPIPAPFQKNGIVPPGIYVDLYGRPVERTPWEYRYSYDEYAKYKSPKFLETDHWDYSDRLWEFNPNKFKKAVAQVWPEKAHSQMFYDKEPADIQKFLSLYYDKPVLLTAVLQGCNKGNGNPYWVFAWREAIDKNEKEN